MSERQSAFGPFALARTDTHRRAMWRDELRASRSPRRIPQPALQYTERPRGSGDYSSPREGTGDLVVYGTQAPSTLQPPHLSTCMKGCGSTNSIPSLSVTVSPSADSGGTMSGTGSGGRFGTGSGSGPGGFNTVSFECDEGRSSRNSVLSAASAFSCWEDGSVCTTGMSSVGRPSSGSMMSADAGNMRAVSGIPRSSSSDEDMGHDDDHDDDIFEPANNLDLGAVDLCVSAEILCRFVLAAFRMFIPPVSIVQQYRVAHPIVSLISSTSCRKLRTFVFGAVLAGDGRKVRLLFHLL